jgi:hypothetical protein
MDGVERAVQWTSVYAPKRNNDAAGLVDDGTLAARAKRVLVHLHLHARRAFWDEV